MRYDRHDFDIRTWVCVDCGASAEMVEGGQVPKDVCEYPPPGCEDADPRDGTWGPSIPHTPLTTVDFVRLYYGDLPEWVHERD